MIQSINSIFVEKKSITQQLISFNGGKIIEKSKLIYKYMLLYILFFQHQSFKKHLKLNFIEKYENYIYINKEKNAYK